jgi:hypothetical protein
MDAGCSRYSSQNVNRVRITIKAQTAQSLEFFFFVFFLERRRVATEIARTKAADGRQKIKFVYFAFRW